MAHIGVVQVESTTLQERRWDAGATKRCYDDEQLLMGVGRRRMEYRNIQKRLKQVGQEGIE